LIFLVFSSCENDNEPVKSTIITGESTVFSDSLPFFSFKAGKAFNYPNKENLIYDFFLLVMTDEEGEAFCNGFNTLENSKLAVLYPRENVYFNNLDTALKIFDTLSILDEDLFYDFGIGVY